MEEPEVDPEATAEPEADPDWKLSWNALSGEVTGRAVCDPTAVPEPEVVLAVAAPALDAEDRGAGVAAVPGGAALLGGAVVVVPAATDPSTVPGAREGIGSSATGAAGVAVAEGFTDCTNRFFFFFFFFFF